MKKAAAIDIGTNSMRLLLCELKDGKILNKSKELVTTRIGHDVSKSGMLNEEAMRRNLDVLKHFAGKAKAFGAEDIVVIATSAVRDAKNREEFLKRSKEEAFVDIKVIAGSEEAELGMLGVMSEFQKQSDHVLVIDIGGGSTELVLADTTTIYYAVSLNAGAVRMTESFIHSNPVLEEDMTALNKSIKEIFASSIDFLKQKKIDHIVAIGGTATTLASMYHQLKVYMPEIVHNSVLDLDYLEHSFKKLKSMTILERYDIVGLQRERADVIPAGLYILIFLLESLGKSQVIISENDNLEGTVMKYVLSHE